MQASQPDRVGISCRRYVSEFLYRHEDSVPLHPQISPSENDALVRESPAGVRHLVAMSHDLPGAGENLFSLNMEYVVVGVEASRKRPCILNLALYAKKVGLDFHGRRASAPQHSTAKRKQKYGRKALTALELTSPAE